MSESKPPFAAGDHLRVWRGLYHHHGIYVGEDRVIQFGGGIFDKPRARIAEVPLSRFLRGGRAEVVDQSKLTWVGLWALPPALPPERIVARARCLAGMPSERTYNLIGRNCETVALWCVCGMGESLQRQRFRVGWALVGVGFTIWYSAQHRFSRRQQLLIWRFLLLRFALLFMYYRHNKRFYDSVRECDRL